MGDLDIGEVAARTGIPPSALRFYEEKGLIRAIGRNGLRRVYADQVVERLSLIALGRAAGFSLAEIGQMLGAGGQPRIDRKKLAARAEELDQTIRRLMAMRKGLRHAAACPAPSHMECPTFRRLMAEAAQGFEGQERRAPHPPSRPRRRP